MNEKELQLKNDVLRRVRTVFYMRTVVRPLLVEAGLFIVAIISVSFLVSVPSIFSNLIQSVSASQYVSYLVGAFTHTQIAVQVLLVLAVIAFALLIKDLIKNIRHLRKLNFA